MKKIVSLFAGLLFAAPLFAFASVGITLSGGTVTITQGSAYGEPGYSAFSTVDGDITSLVVVTGVDTSTPGVHSIGYNVTDSALDSAFASRELVVRSSGSVMPFCSGPLAPGWQVGTAGGGCGGSGMVIPAGSSECPWFITGGCLKQ